MTETFHNNRANPCKGCPDRYPSCADHCEKPAHKAWKAEQEIIKENRKRYKSPAWIRRESFMGRRK